MNKFTTIMLMGLMVGLSCPSNMQNVNSKVEPRDTSIIVGFTSGIKDKTTGSIINGQNNVLNLISNVVTRNFTVSDRYTNITNAVTLNINSAYVDAIRQIPGVSSVTLNKQHSKHTGAQEGTPITIRRSSLNAPTNVSAETMNKPAGTKEGAGVAVAVLDSSFLIDHYDTETGRTYTHESFSDLTSGTALKYTAADMAKIVSTEGFHGKTSKGATGKRLNDKVPFYFDYGGTSISISETGPSTPKLDVYSAISSHGQHVASIIGGNGASYKGIAPNTQLICMKVFTDNLATESTGAYDSVILNALEDCALMGVDVVNLSLGNCLDDFEDDSITMKTIQKLQNNGMSINIAAGNDGKGYYKYVGSYSAWATDVVETGILGSYANNSASMGVAAAVPTKEYFETAFVVSNSSTGVSGTVDFSDQHDGYPLSDLSGEPIPFVKVPGLGEEKDYTGLDVQNKIAVIDRGETTFVAKTTIAYNHGAIAVAIVNNVAGEINFDLTDLSSDVKIPVIGIRKEFRNAFVKTDGTPATGTGQVLVDQEYDSPDAFTPCTFTSDGAKYDFTIKPEISAPGQSIYGAVQLDDNEEISETAYEYYNGTSMATPNYCGAVALLLGEGVDKQIVNEKLMSTADPMKVTNATASKKVHASVRIQGAGMVNIDDAIKTDVYLEGLDVDGTTGLKKSKIQLFNNEDISKGNIKLDFLAHNKTGQNIQYDVTTYVYRPELVSDETLTKSKLAAITDELLIENTSTVTINSGDSKVSLDAISLNQSQKDEINSNFPYGCALEGFVTLSPKGVVGGVELSIPFLGFYGNYESAACVEPFAFEQNANHVYQSDVLNNLCSALGLSKADYKSRWVVGYAESMEDIDLESVAFNETNIASLNGYREITNPEEIYVGNNGVSNTMIIQQLVLRSVKDNTITLTNKNTGEVVLTDHMFSLFYGDERGAGLEHALMKSHAVSDYLVSGLVADRAYSIIPLYNTETKELFPDGEYEMKFSYELVAGGTQTMSYTVHIDSTAPYIENVENITKDGKEMLRVRIKEVALSSLSCEGNVLEFSKDEKGYYADIEKSKYSSSPRIYFKAMDKAGAFGGITLNLENGEPIGSVQSKNITINSVTDITITSSTDKDEIYVAASATTKGKKVDLTGCVVTIKIPLTGVDWSSFEVVDYSDNKLKHSLNGQYLSVEGAPQFIIRTVAKPSQSNTALIIALSVSIPVVVIGGAVIIYFVRKKKIAK